MASILPVWISDITTARALGDQDGVAEALGLVLEILDRAEAALLAEQAELVERGRAFVLDAQALRHQQQAALVGDRGERFAPHLVVQADGGVVQVELVGPVDPDPPRVHLQLVQRHRRHRVLLDHVVPDERQQCVTLRFGLGDILLGLPEPGRGQRNRFGHLDRLELGSGVGIGRRSGGHRGKMVGWRRSSTAGSILWRLYEETPVGAIRFTGSEGIFPPVTPRREFRIHKVRAMNTNRRQALIRPPIVLQGLWVGILIAAVHGIKPLAAQTTYTWNTPAGGAWSEAANWSPAGVPGSGDTAIVVSGRVTVDADVELGHLSQSAGSTMDGTGALVIEQSYTWNGGTLRGRRPSLDRRGRVALADPRRQQGAGRAPGRELRGGGLGRVPVSTGQGAVFANLAGATFTAAAGATMHNNQGGASARFENAGAVVVAPGPGRTCGSSRPSTTWRAARSRCRAGGCC